MGGEEIIYHDMSPKSAYIAPPPPPQQIPTGAPAEEQVVEESAPKKKCSLFTKICIGVIVICAIVLGVTLTRPGALDAFGRQTPSAAEGAGGETTYEPTYVPTYVPTYSPTYAPTPGGDDDDDAVVTTTTVAATQAAVVTTTEAAATTTEAPVDDLDNSTATNATEAAAVDDVNSTEAAVVTTTEATTTTTTTTTTIKLHPVCGNQTNYKVFKIQFTPQDINATYTLTNKETGGVYASIQPGDLPLNEETEERVCIPGGEYEYSMTEGACVKGYYRGNLILYSCNEGVITLVVPKGEEAAEEVVVDEEVVEEVEDEAVDEEVVGDEEPIV